MINVIHRPLPAGAKNNSPKMIVVHAMAEYLKMKDGPMFAPNFLEEVGLSAHALIVPNGDVMMCRSEDQGAYHAKGYNTDSLGVEFLVPGVHDYASFIDTIKTDWVTPEQFEAGIDLVRSWVRGYNIEKVVRHSDISPERKADPGAGFNWTKFISQIDSEK